ncbi:proline racemase family protein [Shewanella submarina]|uniref:Proline racemase family protein n=1 Tax=Shewanella submarina TaxID=2016376 RepID=A0ABV7GEZ6_9GAMM|nr:proline racemase family protein [Shewanella submarina]MCL1035756.1 proline racemase family protein [Shewanella submarina]
MTDSQANTAASGTNTANTNRNSFANWQPTAGMTKITTLEMHTGGEPLRIVTSGFPHLKGDTILAKRQDCLANHDDLRKALMFEPRGHADMYGALIVEPERPDSDFGVLFLHNEGYSTMCGHAIIALSKAAVEAGVIEACEGTNHLRIDAPAGLIQSRVELVEGQVQHVEFDNVPSYLDKAQQRVEVEGIGEVVFDLAWGGAFYAYVDADSIDLNLGTDNANQIIDWGKRIKAAVMATTDITHPFEADLSFLYGVIFTSLTQVIHPGSHSRNVCVFAEGELDRSPTGTGVSGRAAIHHAKGELALGQSIQIESILGSPFIVTAIEACQFGPHSAIIPRVSGSANVVGQHSFYLDPADPLNTGFIFR